MADTGWKSPTSNAGVGGSYWLYPTGAYLEDGLSAQGEYSSSGIVRFSMSFNDGTSYPVTGQQQLTTTNTVYTQGGDSSLWGQSLSPSSFNNDNFHIRVKDEWNIEHDYYGFGFNIPTDAEIDGLEIKLKGYYYLGNYSLRIDVIQAKVYYTEVTPIVGEKYPLPPFRRSV
jgi:hypothetical protein